MKDNFNPNPFSSAGNLNSNNEEINLLIKLQSIRLLQNLNQEIAKNILIYNSINNENSFNPFYTTTNSNINNITFENSPQITDNIPIQNALISKWGTYDFNKIQEKCNNISILKTKASSLFMNLLQNENVAEVIPNSCIDSINRVNQSHTSPEKGKINEVLIGSIKSLEDIYKYLINNWNNFNNYLVGSKRNLYKNKHDDFIDLDNSIYENKNLIFNEVKQCKSNLNSTYLCCICSKSFDDPMLLENHKLLLHSIKSDVNSKITTTQKILSCNHHNCDNNFKTIKQKLTHHNKFDSECKSDKYSVINLISKYKQVILKFTTTKNANTKNKNLLKILKAEFDLIKSQISDSDYFNAIIEDFEE